MTTIKDVLSNILEKYLIEKKKEFKNNSLANKVRNEYLMPFHQLLDTYSDRYILKGSVGQSKWADCPWIGIFDSIKTSSAKNGYYLVYLFNKDMTGVYLSLNQGVTVVKEEYKRSAKKVLSARATDFRYKLNFAPNDQISISLNSTIHDTKLYEQGNILAVYYDANNLPDEEILQNDLRRFLHYYQNLILVDSSGPATSKSEELIESKQRRLHEMFDRRGLSLKIKEKKGYKCEACNFNFEDKYGELGKKFIEAHHLVSFASLNEGDTKLSLNDFAVLCSNCHRMIHRLKDSSNLDELKAIINKNKKK